MQRFLLVGRIFSPLRNYLEKSGCDYIVLKDRQLAKFPHKKFQRRVLADFSSREAVLEAVQEIKQPIDGILATYENYILSSAWISNHLKLPGMSIQSAEACTDKFLMRSAWAQNPEKISPDFAIVGSEKAIEQFAKLHTFPLILKPANLAKSLLVTKSRNLDELLANYRRTVEQIQAVYQRYAPHRQPKLLIEEFLEGSIHSIDAFVNKQGEPLVLEHIVDYQTGYDIGYDDNFHYSRLLPSKLSVKEQVALRRCAALGIRALGMRSSSAHVEIIITKDGPRLVEIGARNGGYRERMHSLSNGLDIHGAALALALGKEPELTATRNEPCAVLELFPKQPGSFIGIHNEQELRALPSLEYLSIKAEPGQQVGKAADGHKMCAVIILHHADKAQFDQDFNFVNKQVCVTTQTSS